MATGKSDGLRISFQSWVLLAVVTIVSVTTAWLAVYSLGESARICRAVDRGNAGNRAAWAFVEETIKAGQPPRTPQQKVHPTVQQRKQDAFFDGIRDRLQPVQC